MSPCPRCGTERTPSGYCGAQGQHAMCALRAELRDVKAERDRLRRLPVIARCHDCAHAETSPHADVCVHPAAGGHVEHGGTLPPPGNCPLREAVGK